VDLEGAVIENCWPEQGCANGACIEPCQAAAENDSHLGCDFLVATPAFYVNIAPPCHAVFIVNGWPRAAAVEVQRGSETHDVTAFVRVYDPDGDHPADWPALERDGLPPGGAAVLFLAHDPSSFSGAPLTCPSPPALDAMAGSAVQGTGLGEAWRIVTSVPVSAYDVLPFGPSDLPSASLLWPTTSWGHGHIAVTPRPSNGPPWGQLLAAEDDTTVEVLPAISLPAAGPAPPAPAGSTMSFVLDAGQYLQWQLLSGQEMSGTFLQSDKPVTFIGGDSHICYSSATSQGGGCDSAHQMIPPVHAQGFEYVAMPYADRGSVPESIPYRIMGSADGTKLVYDPPVAGAPELIHAGEVFDFEHVGPFIVKSQDAEHPLYLAQMMTGANIDGNYMASLGDEEYVNILPPAQFLAKYVFFTDPSYPTTNLVVTRVKTASGFHEVSIDCLGTIGGWTPVGTSGNYEVTNVDLIRLGVSNMGCTNGPHSAESDGPFGLMVWGLDTFSSYAYPAGGSVAPINTVVVPPIPK
jgi:hypothetical protein